MWWEECKSIEAKIIAMRRDLHKIPELGFHLPKTREYVTHQLDEIVEIQNQYHCYGV